MKKLEESKEKRSALAVKETKDVTKSMNIKKGQIKKA